MYLLRWFAWFVWKTTYLTCDTVGSASPSSQSISLEALPTLLSPPPASSSTRDCGDDDDDDDDVTDSLLGVPKDGAMGGGGASAATHNGRKRQLHIKDGDGATTVTGYQDDVKIGDGMDIAIQGENGEYHQ